MLRSGRRSSSSMAVNVARCALPGARSCEPRRRRFAGRWAVEVPLRSVGGGGPAAVRAASQRPGFRRGPDGLLHQGILFWEQDALDAAVRTAAARGFQVAQHAIGNEAISIGLTAIERAGDALDRLAGRPRLEHAMFIDPPLVRRIADAGAIAVVQPLFVHDFGDSEASAPPPKPIEVMPLRRMLDAGVTLAGSSDYPVSHFDVLRAVEAAATRMTRLGEELEPEQAITVEDTPRLHARQRGCPRRGERRRNHLHRKTSRPGRALGEPDQRRSRTHRRHRGRAHLPRRSARLLTQLSPTRGPGHRRPMTHPAAARSTTGDPPTAPSGGS